MFYIYCNIAYLLNKEFLINKEIFYSFNIRIKNAKSV